MEAASPSTAPRESARPATGAAGFQLFGKADNGHPMIGRTGASNFETFAERVFVRKHLAS